MTKNEINAIVEKRFGGAYNKKRAYQWGLKWPPKAGWKQVVAEKAVKKYGSIEAAMGDVPEKKYIPENLQPKARNLIKDALSFVSNKVDEEDETYKICTSVSEKEYRVTEGLIYYWNLFIEKYDNTLMIDVVKEGGKIIDVKYEEFYDLIED